MSSLEDAADKALREARRPRPLLYRLLARIMVCGWLIGLTGMLRSCHFQAIAPKTPTDEVVYRVNNHGDVRYLTKPEYFSSWGGCCAWHLSSPCRAPWG